MYFPVVFRRAGISLYLVPGLDALHRLWWGGAHTKTAERKFPAVFFYALSRETWRVERAGGFLDGFDRYFQAQFRP